MAPVASEKKEIEVFQNEFLEPQQAIRPLQSALEFTDLDKRLNEKLNHLEHEGITGKKEKMLQDTIDYDTNNVYVWKRRRSWNGPLLSASSFKKHVSFSDIEAEAFN